MLPYANIGSVKNKGVDMSVAYSKVIGKDWVLRLNGSLTYAHNEITEIDETGECRTLFFKNRTPDKQYYGICV